MDPTTPAESTIIQNIEVACINTDQTPLATTPDLLRRDDDDINFVTETRTLEVIDRETSCVASNSECGDGPKQDAYIHPSGADTPSNTAQDLCDRRRLVVLELKAQAQIPGPVLFTSDDSDVEDQSKTGEPRHTGETSACAPEPVTTSATHPPAPPSADTTVLVQARVPDANIVCSRQDLQDISFNVSGNNSIVRPEPTRVPSCSKSSSQSAYTQLSVARPGSAPLHAVASLATTAPATTTLPHVSIGDESSRISPPPVVLDVGPLAAAAPWVSQSAEGVSNLSIAKASESSVSEESGEPEGAELAELEMSILSSKSLLEGLLTKPGEHPVIAHQPSLLESSTSLVNMATAVSAPEPFKDLVVVPLTDDPTDDGSTDLQFGASVANNSRIDSPVTSSVSQATQYTSSSPTDELREEPPAPQTPLDTDPAPAPVDSAASEYPEEPSSASSPLASLVPILPADSLIPDLPSGDSLAPSGNAPPACETSGIPDECATTADTIVTETTIELLVEHGVDTDVANEDVKFEETLPRTMDFGGPNGEVETAIEVPVNTPMEIDQDSQDLTKSDSGSDLLHGIVGESSMQDDLVLPQEDPRNTDSGPSSPNLPSSSPFSSQVSGLHHPTILGSTQPSTQPHAEDDAGFNPADEETHTLLPPSSPIRSSEPPTSSPPQLFTSSPPREYDFYSPPTSPQPSAQDKGEAVEWGNDLPSMGWEEKLQQDDTFTKKRGRGEGVMEEVEQHENKRARYSPPPPPNPKRATLQGQKRTHNKLVQPFRSPIVKIEDILAGKDGVYASGRPSNSKKPVKTESPAPGGSSTSVGAFYLKADVEQKVKPKVATKDRTANAAKPFKALVSSDDPKSSHRTLSANAGPTIQTLQARVQKLKQAIKIKNERDADDDERLEVLVAKWRTVGREVAWLVWDTVKDLDPGEGLNPTARGGGWHEDAIPRGTKSAFKNDGFQAGWGWDGEKKGKHDGYDRSWGWDDKQVVPTVEGEDGVAVDEPMEVDEEEPQVQNHSLGTMLRHLGIDPDTLGWDEDEGDFVGDA